MRTALSAVAMETRLRQAMRGYLSADTLWQDKCNGLHGCVIHDFGAVESADGSPPCGIAGSPERAIRCDDVAPEPGPRSGKAAPKFVQAFVRRPMTARNIGFTMHDVIDRPQQIRRWLWSTLMCSTRAMPRTRRPFRCPGSGLRQASPGAARRPAWKIGGNLQGKISAGYEQHDLKGRHWNVTPCLCLGS